jgi:Ca-activated chloride channel family protein
MFQNSHYFLYFIFAALAAVVFVISFKILKNDFKSFASEKMLNEISTFSFKKYFTRGVLLTLALMCIVFALARPKFGIKQTESKSVASDIVIALDTSKSMNARDLTPDRITRAKMVFSDIIKEVPAQRVGLEAFAGKAFWQSPLTNDLNAFSMFLNLIDTDTVPFDGTNIAAAINLAADSLKNTPKGSKALVLITDGENLEGNIDEALKNAVEQGLVIFTVGIGSTKGEPIPLYENGTMNGYIKDERGNIVLSKLDESTLKRIADETGGKYFNLSDNFNISELAADLNNLHKVEGDAFMFANLEDRFYIPLAFAVMFLILFFFMPEVKHFKFIAVFIAVTMFASPSGAASMSEGVSRYNKQKFPEALGIFQTNADKKPTDPKINYNLANAYYKNNDFASALKHYQTAFENTTDKNFQSVLLYNMGNTAYRADNKEAAKNYYKEALNLNPADINAKHNLEFLDSPQQNSGGGGDKDEQKDKQEQEQQQNEPKPDKLDETSENLLNYFDEQDKHNQKAPQTPEGKKTTNYW